MTMIKEDLSINIKRIANGYLVSAYYTVDGLYKQEEWYAINTDEIKEKLDRLL
jgi:hypothetical protein